jgi:hypothetical protein
MIKTGSEANNATTSFHCTGSELVTAVKTSRSVLWVATPCGHAGR